MDCEKLGRAKCGATTLSEIVPWLTLDQCMAVLEMKDDNIEQATDYCLGIYLNSCNV